MGCYSGEAYSADRINFDGLQEMSAEVVTDLIRSLREAYDESNIEFTSTDYDIDALMEANGTGSVKGNPFNYYGSMGMFYMNLGNYQLKTMKIIKNTAQDMVHVILTQGITKGTGTKLVQIFQNGISEATKVSLSNIDYQSMKKIAPDSDQNKAQAALILTSQAAFVNSLFQLIFTLILRNRIVASALTAMICAPFTEEISKAIAIRGGYEKEFLLIFNAVEFGQYVIRYAPTKGLINIVITRLVCVGVHLSTTLVQWIFAHAADIGLAKANSDQKTMIGQIIAILMHASWNTMAVLG